MRPNGSSDICVWLCFTLWLNFENTLYVNMQHLLLLVVRLYMRTDIEKVHSLVDKVNPKCSTLYILIVATVRITKYCLELNLREKNIKTNSHRIMRFSRCFLDKFWENMRKNIVINNWNMHHVSAYIDIMTNKSENTNISVI